MILAPRPPIRIKAEAFLCACVLFSGCRTQSAFAGLEAPSSESTVSIRRDGSGTWFHAGERELIGYRDVTVRPPHGVDAVYARSGYLHPLRSPAGHAVTGDFPSSHRHQHGVFLAWTRTLFENRPVDFWNTADGTGRIECVGLTHAPGLITARHQHVDLSAPGGPRTALLETWEIAAAAEVDATVVDIVSTLTCAGDSPVEILAYPYGGFAVRGPEAWEGDRAQFLTSEGLDREQGDGSTARWCAMWGPVGESVGESEGKSETAGVAVLGHPHNLRAPQPLRLHPSNPYFCFTPCQAGPFSIEPGRPLVSRYRLIAFDGPPNAKTLESAWRAFADEPHSPLH